MSRTALIAGAGIGGLAAGIALRRSGWNIRIFERADSARELGFGLLIGPNAIATLNELGAADQVLEQGHSPISGEIRRFDGTPLRRLDFPPPTAFGGPTLVALRPALHGTLLEAVGEDVVSLGSEVVGFRISGQEISLEIADGTSAKGDLLIGADGLNSVIRRSLHPSEAPPHPSGIIALRGTTHGAVPFLEGLSGIYYTGPGIEGFLVRASEDGIYWALSVAQQLLPMGVRDAATILAHIAPQLDTTFRDIATGAREMRFDELVDRDPLPFWSSGPVTLLGDAAHPLLPHTGQGAAQALADAVALGKAALAAPDLPNALAEYESRRRRFTDPLLAQGRRTARFMRITNPAACWLREFVLRLAPEKLLVKTIGLVNRQPA